MPLRLLSRLTSPTVPQIPHSYSHGDSFRFSALLISTFMLSCDALTLVRRKPFAAENLSTDAIRC
jgi:hypothetical protein